MQTFAHTHTHTQKKPSYNKYLVLARASSLTQQTDSKRCNTLSSKLQAKHSVVMSQHIQINSA